eukprot:2781311-Rhodomonas_salina.1
MLSTQGTRVPRIHMLLAGGRVQQTQPKSVNNAISWYKYEKRRQLLQTHTRQSVPLRPISQAPHDFRFLFGHSKFLYVAVASPKRRAAACRGHHRGHCGLTAASAWVPGTCPPADSARYPGRVPGYPGIRVPSTRVIWVDYPGTWVPGYRVPGRIYPGRFYPGSTVPGYPGGPGDTRVPGTRGSAEVFPRGRKTS